MAVNEIKNVVFDVGNVIVRWAPAEIVRLTFGVEKPESLMRLIFQSDVWQALNRGKMSVSEAQLQFQQVLGFSHQHTEQLFYYVKQTQLLLFGSVDLLKRIKQAGYGVYALTDNVTEVVAYLKSTYDFWSLFDGATVSADIGWLKPEPEIYHHLLEQQNISSSASVFIDDMAGNVAGAKSLGFSGIQFANSTQCEAELKSLGLTF